MFKSAVLLIAMLLLVVSFQNCGNTVPTGAATSVQNLGDATTYETPLVNVRQVAKSSSSNSAKIVLDGFFRSGCPATVDPIVQSNGSVHTVRAVVTSQNLKDVACTMALVPFEAPVTLENLSSGTHTVRFETEDGPKEIALEVE
jgi:hypothetical protein